MADIVARINVSVHLKLLSGYLLGAMLVLGMAVLTLVVISSMNNQVEELTRLQKQVASATKKNNLVTSQLHFRTLALLFEDEAQYAKISEAKTMFSEELARAEAKSPPAKAEFFQRLRDANDRFATAGSRLLAQSSNPEEAMRIHLEEERPISVELMELLDELVADTNRQMKAAETEFQSDRKLLAIVGWALA